MSIKVSSVFQPDSGVVSVRGSEVKGTHNSGASVFRRVLSELSHEAHVARLHSLKTAIDEQGKRLVESVDVRELEKYRGLIKEFLGEIVSGGYRFFKEDAYALRGRHRYIATVRIVDEKLDELGKTILEEQADTIDLVHRIDDIRGLLLDMML